MITRKAHIKRSPLRRCTKKYKKEDGYSQYWFNKLYRYVMDKFIGQECIICGTTVGTHGHHILRQKYYPAFKCDSRHIVPVCASCHSEWCVHNPAAHSNNAMMQYEFMEIVKAKYPDKFAVAWENRKNFGAVRMDYMELYNQLAREEV